MSGQASTFDPSSYSFDSVALNGVVVFVIQQMKLSNSRLFSWISCNTPFITRAVAVVGAAITASAMSVNWSEAAGVGTLTISGITPENMALFAWQIIKNLMFQHGIYKSVFAGDRPAVPPAAPSTP